MQQIKKRDLLALAAPVWGSPHVPLGRHPEPEFRVVTFLPLQVHSTRSAHNGGVFGLRPMPMRIGSRNVWPWRTLQGILSALPGDRRTPHPMLRMVQNA